MSLKRRGLPSGNISVCVKYRNVKETEQMPNKVSVKAVLVTERELTTTGKWAMGRLLESGQNGGLTGDLSLNRTRGGCPPWHYKKLMNLN